MRPDMGNFMKGISHTKSLTLKEESGGFLGNGADGGGGGLTREWRARHKEELHVLYLQRVLLK